MRKILKKIKRTISQQAAKTTNNGWNDINSCKVKVTYRIMEMRWGIVSWWSMFRNKKKRKRILIKFEYEIAVVMETNFYLFPNLPTDGPNFNRSYKLSQLLGVKFNIIYRYFLIFHIGSNIPHYPVGSQLHISTLGNCCIKKFCDLKNSFDERKSYIRSFQCETLYKKCYGSTNTWIEKSIVIILQASFQ